MVAITLLVLCALLTFAAPRANAAANCSFSSSTLSLDFQPTPGEVPKDDHFPNDGDTLRLNPSGPVEFGYCYPKPSNLANTDKVVVTDSSGGLATRVGIDPGGSGPTGAYGPGATDEGDGFSEVEFDIDLGQPSMPGFDNLFIEIARSSPGIRIGSFAGATWANLNSTEEPKAVADPDLVVHGLERTASKGWKLEEFIFVSGSAADDRIFGSGGPGFDGPSQTPLLLKGGRGDNLVVGGAAADGLQGAKGNDRLKGKDGNDALDADRGRDRLAGGKDRDRLDGGGGPDVLIGGPGKDRHEGGPGSDTIKARDGERDKVSCGSGRDTAIADKKDRVDRDCERVRRR